MKGLWMAVAVASLAAAQGAWAQDAKLGEQVFRKCMPCHRIGPGAKNLVGPELNGLDGRHTGIVPGYDYSDPNKKSGIVWNEETFEKYIKDPRGVIPGTKMFFTGIKNGREVHNLWAYLKQFGPDGKTK